MTGQLETDLKDLRQERTRLQLRQLWYEIITTVPPTIALSWILHELTPLELSPLSGIITLFLLIPSNLVAHFFLTEIQKTYAWKTGTETLPDRIADLDAIIKKLSK